MEHESIKYGPQWHRLKVTHPGEAGELSKQGFMYRAAKLCNDMDFEHKSETASYDYQSREAGYVFTYTSYATVGDVVCHGNSKDSAPVASISDGYKQHNIEKTDFFYVDSINLKPTDNSRTRSLKENIGRGLSMRPYAVTRNVPAGKTTLTLVARTTYAAPILTLTNRVYEVKGTLSVDLDPYRSYIVKGELSDDYSAVWLEDKELKTIVGRKIEVNGKGRSRVKTFDK